MRDRDGIEFAHDRHDSSQAFVASRFQDFKVGMVELCLCGLTESNRKGHPDLGKLTK